jgi:hypothetical protein
MSARNPNRHLVEPARELSGNIAVPGDKSISHRALMPAALRTALPKSPASWPAKTVGDLCALEAWARRTNSAGHTSHCHRQ